MSSSDSNPASVDLKDMLVAELGYTFGTDVFVGSMPEEPDDCIALFDTGGFGLEEYGYEKPSVQIRVRNNKYLGGHQAARDIKYKLATGEMNNTTVNDTRYIMIKDKSDVLYLGVDENDRKLFTINFQIHRSGI